MHRQGLKVVEETRAPNLLFWRIALGFLGFWLLVLLATAAVAATAISGSVGWAIYGAVLVVVGGASMAAFVWVWRLLSVRVSVWQATVDALARDGVVVSAEVIGKEERDRQELLELFVYFQFRSDFVVEARDYSLERKIFDLPIGTLVEVRHVRDDPEVCQLISPAPPSAR